MIHNRSRTGPTIFVTYNVLRVTDMYALELGTFMYRKSVNKLSSSFSYHVTKRFDVNNYSTRYCNHLNIPMKTFSGHSVPTGGPKFGILLELARFPVTASPSASAQVSSEQELEFS